MYHPKASPRLRCMKTASLSSLKCYNSDRFSKENAMNKPEVTQMEVKISKTGESTLAVMALIDGQVSQDTEGNKTSRP